MSQNIETKASTSPVARGKVAAIQLVSGKDIAFNLERVAYWVGEAAAQGVKVVVLPENFSMLDSYSSIELGRKESSPDGQVRQFLRGLARSHGIWIIAGSLPCSVRPDGSTVENRVRSACWVIDADGKEVGRYDKIHLFDVDVDDQHGQYRESQWFEPGDRAVVVDTPVGRVGLSICYDLRFPELYRKLSESGADWMVVPAAFTYRTGEAHWETLLRSRAIENQVYIVAAGQGGQHSSTRTTYGHSMLVDPWGSVLECRREAGEGMVVGTIDPDFAHQVRSKMPVLQHRRVK
ncbi:carbon-nitrogen hydrolase [Hahella sp. CCB-MM4]|uniref:carbon-nitrogen hydrolase family protein n=1 Tax=Hahella sp. (strain CCB-MM4) TaxID=1926491 RepID=UPI000B9AB0BB|nr:carbon-nitrogen hydrolase family protein [Hahella sp. CCB-MM4]OZG70549.1 carbon-nitrogen hydrolase [Hahella sp. CCB-MM4]